MAGHQIFLAAVTVSEPVAARALRREVPAPVLFLILRVGGRDYNRGIASAWV